MLHLMIQLEEEKELLHELLGQICWLDRKRRGEITELVFENREMAKDPNVCYLAALNRLVQIETGDVCPDEPVTLTRGMGSKDELKVEVPPKSRCKTA